jgi:hypothetical protein
MLQTNFVRRAFLGVLLGAGAMLVATMGRAQNPSQGRDQLIEPVFRVTKVGGAGTPRQEQPHPLDPALRIAYDGLAHIRNDVRDYTATIVKRERIDGELTEQEFMSAKIRNRKVDSDGRIVVPLSVYLKFLAPKAKKGREVIWVEGANNGKLIGHGTGVEGFITVYLDPTGYFSMKGNRYPITDIGIETLVDKLIEKGERDRKRDECEVQFYKGAKINGRACTLLQVTHPVKRDYFDFNVAEIFIDDELNVPVRYAAYQWPTTPGGKPILDEEYTYMNIKLNVGLTDADFDPKNPAYEYP